MKQVFGGDPPVMSYRFTRRWFRKSSCDLCHCMVERASMEYHAKWHQRSGDVPVRHSPSVHAFCDITVLPDGKVLKSRWRSAMSE